jgi:hypothetical protein
MAVITDYEIVTATHVRDLQDRVRERIHSGWQPVGGVAVVHEEDAGSKKPNMVFAQAIVVGNGTGTIHSSGNRAAARIGTARNPKL